MWWKLVVVILIIIVCLFAIIFIMNKRFVFKGGSYNYDKFNDTVTKTNDIFGNDIVMELDKFFDSILIHFNIIKEINGKTPTELYKENFDKFKFKNAYNKINGIKRIKLSNDNKPIIQDDVVTYDYSSIVISYDDHNLKISGKEEIILSDLPKSIHEYYLTKNSTSENKQINGVLDYIFSYKDDLSYPYLYIEDSHNYKRNIEFVIGIKNYFEKLINDNKEIVYYYFLNRVYENIRNINNINDIISAFYGEYSDIQINSINDIIDIICYNQSPSSIDKYGLMLERKNINNKIRQDYENLKSTYESEYEKITDFNETQKELKIYTLVQLFAKNKAPESVYKYYNIQNSDNIPQLNFDGIIQIICKSVIKMLFYYVVILFIDIITKTCGFEQVKYIEETYHKRFHKETDFERTYHIDSLLCPIQYFTRDLNINSYLFDKVSTDMRYHEDVNTDLMLLKEYIENNVTFTMDDYDNILDHQNIDKFLKHDILVKFCYNNANLTLASFIYITIMNKFIGPSSKSDEWYIDTKNNFINFFSNSLFETSKEELAFYVILFIAFKKKFEEKNKKNDVKFIENIRVILTANLRGMITNIPLYGNFLKMNIKSLFMTYEDCAMIYSSNIVKHNKDNACVIEYILFVYYGQKSLVVTEHINYGNLTPMTYKDINDNILKHRNTALTYTETLPEYKRPNYIDIVGDKLFIKRPELYTDLQISLETTIMDTLSAYKMFSYPLLENNKDRINMNYKNPFNVLFIFYGGNLHGMNYSNVLKNIYN